MDADDWRRYLTRSKAVEGQGLGPNTARRRCGIAKQFFRAAHRRHVETFAAGVEGARRMGERGVEIVARRDCPSERAGRGPLSSASMRS